MNTCDNRFRELMKQVREGSEDAARQLVDEYGDSIRRAVRRALHERLRSKFDSLDFVQIVWNSLFRVREKLGRFDKPEELTAYLVKMARNKVGMEVRRRLMSQKHGINHEESLDELQDSAGVDISSQQPTPMDEAIAHEQWNRLMEGQPSYYCQIAQLRLQGYTYRKIADQVGVDERTVRRVLKRLLQGAGT